MGEQKNLELHENGEVTVVDVVGYCLGVFLSVLSGLAGIYLAFVIYMNYLNPVGENLGDFQNAFDDAAIVAIGFYFFIGIVIALITGVIVSILVFKYVHSKVYASLISLTSTGIFCLIAGIVLWCII